MPTRFDIGSDRRASAPGHGNRSDLFRFLYALIPKLKGSVPCGASTSKQPDHVSIKINGGASNSRQPDDVVRESDAGAFTSRQQGDVVMEMDAGASTSRQYNDAVREIEEKTPRNADQGRDEPETEEDIRERVEWVASIQQRLQDYTRSEAAETETTSIPRVTKGPRGFGQAVEKAYEPSVISIGPYHRGMPRLHNMQKRKWQCLKDIDDRLNDIDNRLLNGLFEELKKEENRARSFYPECKQQLERGDFLEMLLLDGCFIIDYLRRASSVESKTKIWSDHQIRNDLLLLENQLPFFVVECIYRLVKRTNDKKMVEIAVDLFHNISPKVLETVHELEKRNFKHLLHLYHAYLFFDERDDWKEKEASQVLKKRKASQVLTIPSAILLEEAGIKFKKRKKIDKAINVRFKDGVMKITPLVIDAFTISQFLNLIEFERAHPNMEPRFTAFVQFMDYIINTSEDVALLRKNGILEHAFGSDEELAGIINQLTSGTFHYLPWELKNVYEKADIHCKAKWNRWRATLLRDYFGNPWAAMATLAVFLTFIETFFPAASYFRP
ncbi:UPF0481-like protein [Cinnamomum micranthum f. kanehirae]|uniref:UPF0481-like protein n=1 Tax=Cinnamomum micranthum f. kanehirae TaxID=337451 RepID=A0A3S3MXA0_9MAGN|nr:UPF0481-like protein [Cinnamomum micranthum f. kanehirae]